MPFVGAIVQWHFLIICKIITNEKKYPLAFAKFIVKNRAYPQGYLNYAISLCFQHRVRLIFDTFSLKVSMNAVLRFVHYFLNVRFHFDENRYIGMF